jgi:hypothetical protein
LTRLLAMVKMSAMYELLQRVGRVRRVRRMKRVETVGCVLAVVLFCSVGRAQAEPTADDKALATVLFQEGRTLMSEGRIAEACVKLEESQRLDPSGGTVLNLALCHQQEGRLARSWSEFNDAVALARRDGRRDREVAAADHARALAPRLSKLTVIVPTSTQVQGLRIERDGRELGPGAWSTAMPVDGGEHVVRATAPGREPFTKTVVIGKESDAQTVEIPVLVVAPMVANAQPGLSSSSAPPALVLAPAPAAPIDRGPSPGGVRRTLGWALGGAGVVQLGLAGFFGLRAFDKHCANNSCGTEDDARSAADVSTVLTITGIASAATGIYLLVTSRNNPASSTESRVTLDISSRGLTVGRRF